jgi:hypothetical protein
MNLLRNGLLMRKTGDRRRTELTETFAFLCGFSAEFITCSKTCAPTLFRQWRNWLCINKSTRLSSWRVKI